MSSPEQVLTIIVLVVAAASAAGVAARRLWRFVRLSVHAFDTIVGRSDQPGLVEQLSSLAKQVTALAERTARIEHELHPNSGQSVRDAVDRIDRKVDSLARTHRRNAAEGKARRQQDHEVYERLAARVDELKNRLDQQTGGTP
jgi:hypothetical protein